MSGAASTELAQIEIEFMENFSIRNATSFKTSFFASHQIDSDRKLHTSLGYLWDFLHSASLSLWLFE